MAGFLRGAKDEPLEIVNSHVFAQSGAKNDAGAKPCADPPPKKIAPFSPRGNHTNSFFAFSFFIRDRSGGVPAEGLAALHGCTLKIRV